jgi:hypothetical protein
MKRHNFNKLLTVFGILFVLSLSSCVKNYRANETDLNDLKPTANIVEGGLYQFSTQALLFPGSDDVDTATFHVNYAAVSVAPANEVFTLAVDPAAITNYNTSGGGLQYEILPDSCYSFTATSVTVAKGQTYSDAIPVIFYPSKIDGQKNYMLPISLTNAPAGITISSNIGTLYYHFIGNPIAGSYTENWRRWNATDTTGTPNYNQTNSNILSPETPLQVSATSASNGAEFHISFTNTNGVLSNFNVALDPSSYGAFGLGSLSQAPIILIADPVKGIYSFYFKYSNTATPPGQRTIIETFTKTP